MNDQLKRLLDPGDDGRAFRDAVLLKASGALYRRRMAADTRSNAWDWLERWARPWVVAALVIVAVAAAVPLLRHAPAAGIAVEPVAEASLLAAPQPEDLLTVSLGN